MADTNLLVLAREFKKLREEVKKVLQIPKGDKGDQGIKGEKGDKGDIGPQGFPGRDGKDGIDGYNGKDGRDGVDGKDGKDGLDGVGVTNAYIDFDNSLVIVLSNGTEVNAGYLSQETKDAVIANFKQGAYSINELLPSQAGNSNKFLKTDGTNVSWDTLDGSDIDLSSPPVIGNVTPNAATFTTLTATGQTSLGGAAGSESFRALNLANSANWIEAKGSIAGTGASGIPTLFVNGSDGVTQLGIGVKGISGYIKFFTSGTVGTEQFRVAATASAVNYVQVTGAATTSFPVLSSQGSDTNIGFTVASKGSGSIRFANNNNGNQVFRIDGSTTASVNYFQVAGANTNIEPTLSAQGSDANISVAFLSKGTGAIDLAAGSSGVNISNGGTVTAITRTGGGSGYTSIPSVVITAPTTAGGVQATATVTAALASVTSIASGGTGYSLNDVLTVTGSYTTAVTLTVTGVTGGVITSVSISSFGVGYTAIPANPAAVTGGTGTGATFNLSWGISNFTITNAGSGYVEQPTVSFSGGGGSGAAAYAVVGSDTVVRGLSSNIDFYVPAGRSFRVYDNNSGTFANFVSVRGATTGNPTLIYAQGETNTGLSISSNGSGFVRLMSAAGSLEQFRAASTANAVNYVQVTGAATTSAPVISAQGSDTNITMQYYSKGTGQHIFATRGGTGQFRILDTASAVNYISVTGAVANAAPTFSAAGSDTNIDLALTPKGTGLVRFGTYTAGAPTATGYISIKAADGTIYKVLVGT